MELVVSQTSMPGWWPWMAVRMVGSPAGTMAAVMAFSLGCVGGERCCGGWPWRLLCCGSEGAQIWLWRSWLRSSGRLCYFFVPQGNNRVKALCFIAGSDGVLGYYFPLEDIVAVSPLQRFRVKTFALRDSAVATLRVVILLGGVVVERR